MAFGLPIGVIVAIEIVTPEEYVRPDDGFDYCAGCDYLEPVAYEYCVDDGSRVVPLCEVCFRIMASNNGGE